LAAEVFQNHLRLPSQKISVLRVAEVGLLPSPFGDLVIPIAKLIQHVSQGPDFVPHQLILLDQLVAD